jgi:hypothetical protein
VLVRTVSWVESHIPLKSILNNQENVKILKQKIQDY